METRPFTPSDAAAVEAFLARIPSGESTFFKEDISDPGIVQRWAEDANGACRTLAWDGGDVVGYAAVIPGVGWSSHVGEVRLVVDPQRRRSGIMARSAAIDTMTSPQ